MQTLDTQEIEVVSGGIGPLMLVAILFSGSFAATTAAVVAIKEK
ncbi:class IIb bacteriocin, lactobin A/cerein 7B family [Chitinimonas sp. PSY-7]